jgi:lambda-carrageenase
MKKLWMGFLLGMMITACSSEHPVVNSFSTDGHVIYHVQPATVQPNDRAVVAAAYDGDVLCYTPDGTLLWQAATGEGFPFDLCVADIDADGLDESFVASSDGSLYAFDNDGTPLWTFRQTAPLFQVCVVKLPSGKSQIYTGGIDKTLYALDAGGKLTNTLQLDYIVRHMRAGDIGGTGQTQIAITTADRGLSGTLSLLLVDPGTLEIQWEKTDLGTHAHNSGKRFFSMVILDLDDDGREDILLSNSWGENGKIFAYDGSGNEMYTASDEQIPNISYRMNLLKHIDLPNDDYVLGHFGNVLIQYNRDGTCRKVLTGKYSFANGAFDPETSTYYLGSAVSGGDGIHALQLNNPEWEQAYVNMPSMGRLQEIEANIARLNRQIKTFQPPAWQPNVRPITVLSRKPEGSSYENITFMGGKSLSQKYENRDKLWNRGIDARRSYDKTADEIVEIVREMEAEGRGFVIWAGHGHGVHMPLSTLERMIDAAPEHLWGFEFAEMEGVDDHMREVVEEILLPLAEMCRKTGKKIIFRNKNIFWSGSSYVPYWRRVLFESGFEDVFVPALEETNSRTAELSLSGRLGLWMTGRFNQWSCRMVTDNANFDRMWEWAGHQVLNHHLRHIVSRAALGSDVFFNSIHQGPLTDELYKQLTPFYDMLEKGIVYIPRQEDLLSISPVAIGMKSPPDELYIQHGINGHAYRYPDDDHASLVFDRLDGYWGGAPLLDHDFSTYAMDLKRRMCNFLPITPYAMPVILPDNEDISSTRFTGKISTDGRYYYDDDGQRREAAEYKPVVENALREAAAQLPLRVKGNVHWSAARLDETHVRITLIDPGYLDPAQRDCEIVLQHLDGVTGQDILSGENLEIVSNRIHLTVPAGIFRIIDIEHK